MQNKITAFDILYTFDHGQYWQGAGVAFTDWDEVATGFGGNTLESLDDALERLEMNGWDTSEIVTDLEEIGMQCECDESSEPEECEHGWFVSVYVR